jgi:nickel/cobalt transporter (NicO) family protein
MEQRVFSPTYIGIILIGLLHGFEPGHGWPVAVLYSMRRKNAVLSATISSTVIGIGHLISSIAVVIAYVLLQKWLNFEAPWIKYIAAGLLVLLAIKLYREKVDDLEKQHGHIHPESPEIEHEHEHEHPGQGRHTHVHEHKSTVALSLLGLASFAFILGFAHEEEIALLALVASGLNAWVLMISYGLSVLIGLIAVTIVGVKIYKQFQPKLARFEKYIPKISAVLLAIMAILIAVL